MLGMFAKEGAGVLHGRVDCVSLCICLLVSHRCVSLFVRIWALDVWGEFDQRSKIFNPPFPVLKAIDSTVHTLYIGIV